MLVEANRQCYSLSTEVRKYLQFSHGDVRSFNLEQTFDAAILLFHVLSYQISNNDIISTFKAVNYHLQPGGIFIFDMWYGPAVLSNPPLVRIKRLEDEKVKIIRIAEPTINYTDSVVDVNYQILVFDKETHSVEEIHETHRMRYLFCPELDSFLEDTNFRTLEKGEWLTTDSLNNRTWSAYRVVQKIA
ncbi:MAG: hypothetical protein LVS60_13955 [Nodosilinea sp. LVE1205-7]|jgi:SAM-dependent methyltransferase